MNKVIISGNLTKDMEVNVTKKDVLVGKFTVAVQIGYGDNSKTQFYPVILFGNRVESLQKYLLKGTKVLIDGQIDYNSIQNDEGEWKNYFQIIVNDLEILKFVEIEEDNNKNKKYKKYKKSVILMYEEIILEIIQHVKDDIEVDKLEINKIRKERNKLKKYIKAGEDLQLYNETLGLEIFKKEECINNIKEKINKEKKAIYRLNRVMDLLK